MAGGGGMIAAALGRIANWSLAHRRFVVAAAAVASTALAVTAFVGLSPSAGTESLVPKAASASSATERIRARFGDDPIVVMAEGDLAKILLSADLGRMLGLEGCLGGRVPKGATAYGGAGGPCARIARTGDVQRVYGPATFLNEAANQVSGQVSVPLQAASERVKRAAAKARAEALAKGLGAQAADAAARQAGLRVQNEVASLLAQLQAQTGIRGLPSLANSEFVSSIVFDPGKGPGYPKTKFAYLFPSGRSAIIQVRPKPGLSSAERRELIADVRDATRMKQFKLKSGIWRVTGAPVLAESLADEVAVGAIPLLVFAALAMALALGFAFRVSFRLLPLTLALASAAGVFGGMALLGLPLTVAAVGGVPVLIGLSVDYAVQYQASAAERLRKGASGQRSVVEAASLAGPPILAAAVATSAGFLALLVSPVPMVRGFGLALIAGVILALVVSFTVGSALITARFGRQDAFVGLAARIDASVAGAGEIVSGLPGAARLRAARSAAGSLLGSRPGATLAVAALLAFCGWGLDSTLSVESDITRLVPSGTPALADLQALQAESGIAGEVDVMVSGKQALAPATLAWLRQFNTRALREFGYSEQRGCRGGAELCPGVSITDLVGPAASTEQVRNALRALPEYFTNAVVTPDGSAALSGFGVSLLPLQRQQEVFEYLRQQAKSAPKGVRVDVGGLTVIAAEANSRLADPVSRWRVTLLALLAVAIALAVTLRSFRRVIVPLAATALATGWAALGLWILGIELNPLSAALGALVIAIATEFAVLLSERQHSELAAGGDPESALGRAIGSTGRAIAISGLTVIAGFAVLGFSQIRVLRDFGFATVVNLALALAAVAVVVPAMVRILARGERRGDDPAEATSDGVDGEDHETQREPT